MRPGTGKGLRASLKGDIHYTVHVWNVNRNGANGEFVREWGGQAAGRKPMRGGWGDGGDDLGISAACQCQDDGVFGGAT